MSHSLRTAALRTVWISDVHLGSRSCRANLLLDFLNRTRCEVLYLVGDIIDLESLRHDFYWPNSHTEVLRTLLRMSYEGTRVVYIPGNHDEALRAYVGAQLGNVDLVNEAIHTTRTGRRLLVTHGDQFDAIVRSRNLAVLLGAQACVTLLELNRFVHWLHDILGRPYWSLADHVKSRVGVVRRCVERYRDAALTAAGNAGVDGIICGHIHRAELVEIDGLLYCNDGDWVESCTALVEDHTGSLALLRWRPSAAAVSVHGMAWQRSATVSVRARLRRKMTRARLFYARQRRRVDRRTAAHTSASRPEPVDPA